MNCAHVKSRPRIDRPPAVHSAIASASVGVGAFTFPIAQVCGDSLIIRGEQSIPPSSYARLYVAVDGQATTEPIYIPRGGRPGDVIRFISSKPLEAS